MLSASKLFLSSWVKKVNQFVFMLLVMRDYIPESLAGIVKGSTTILV